MVDRYSVLLDLYPLLSSFPAEASLLVVRCEQEAFKFLRGDDCELLSCLRLSRDLGYLDERVFYFLEKRVLS